MKLIPLLPFAALTLGALAAATPSLDESKYDKALQAELLAIKTADESSIQQLSTIGREHGWMSPEIQPARDARLKIQTANLARIDALLNQRGWIGPEVAGPEAAQAIFTIIQHSDVLTQQKYLPLLQRAVQDGKARAADLAWLEDSVALAEGRRQIYGTQVEINYLDSLPHVRPVEDVDHVDARRAAVGLPPMAEYLKAMNLTWDVEAHKREIPLLESFARDIIPARGKADPALQAQLLAILDLDQRGRRRINDVEKKFGHNSPEMTALWKEIAAADEANLPRVTTLLDTHGWVGPEVVGSEAASAIFLVIQHSDLAVQQKYLPMMRAAAAERRARAADLALLEDRIALREGRPQVYGSQLEYQKDGQLVVSKLVDPLKVDERRATVGLNSMSEYLKYWNLTWDAAAFAAAQAQAEAAKP